MLGEDGILSQAQLAAERTKIEEYRTVLELIRAGLQTDKILEDLSTEEFLTRYEERAKNEEKNGALKGSTIEGPQEDMNGKVRVTTKEDYVYDITEKGVEYRGKKGEIPETPDLQEADINWDVDPRAQTRENVTVKISLKEPKEGYTLQYAKKDKNEKPTDEDWANYEEGTVLTFTQNGNAFARLVNSLEEAGDYATKDIGNIDRLAPQNFEAKAEARTNSITVKGHTEDQEENDMYAKSKIIEYYFKEITDFAEDRGQIENEEGWTGKVEVTEENEGTDVSYTFTELTQETSHTFVMKAVDEAGNEKISEPIKISTKGVPGLTGGDDGIENPDITFKAEPSNLTNEQVTVTIIVNKEIEEGYTLQYVKKNKGEDAPTKDDSEWKNCANNEKVTFDENGNLYVRLVDSTKQEGTYATKDISNIDTADPTAGEGGITTEVTDSQIIATLTANDTGGSGIAKVVWSYSITEQNDWKSAGENSYKEVHSETTEKGESTQTATKLITGLNPATTYDIKAVIWDVAGNTTEVTRTGVKTSDRAVTSVTVSSTTGTIVEGGTITLKATITPSDATNQNLTWSATPDGTVSINASADGKTATITGLKLGKAIVTVQSQADANKKATATIEVIKAISKTESFVGYYADVDGVSGVDGVIYADLAIGKTGQWGNSNGAYTITPVTAADLKEYKITQESYSGKFGTKPVLARVNQNDTSKQDRFYVMALNDIDNQVNGTEYCWWADATNKISTSLTLTDFGKGKSNTDNIMAEWNKEPPTYAHDTNSSRKDIWGQITTQYNKGWFVPSRGEWAAFADAFGITKSNYNSTFSLSHFYYSSSLRASIDAWEAIFYYGYMNYNNLNSNGYARLSTTF